MTNDLKGSKKHMEANQKPKIKKKKISRLLNNKEFK